jgi:polynucleotide 5'-kinase involved in rRNA processing
MLGESKKISIGPNCTLILKGPASARILEGSLEALGYRPGPRDRLVAKPWRSLPLYSSDGAVVEVILGEGGSAELVGEDTIPREWRDLSNAVGESFKLMVIGGVDSGKTSLITYLYNNHVAKGGVWVADLDMGQSEICPPTTIAVALGGRPTPSLSVLEPTRVFPVGYTSPSHFLKKALDSVSDLVFAVGGEGRLLVNTDGWVEGDPARSYKAQLVRILRPSHVVLIGLEGAGEIEQALAEVGADLIQMRTPAAVMKRDQSARKALRELHYARYLRGSRLRSIPRRWLRVRPLLFPTLSMEDYLKTVVTELEQSAHQAAPLINGLDMTEAGIGIISYMWANDSLVPKLSLFAGIDDKSLARFYTPHEGAVGLMEVGAVILSTSFKEVHVLKPSS